MRSVDTIRHIGRRDDDGAMLVNRRYLYALCSFHSILGECEGSHKWGVLEIRSTGAIRSRKDHPDGWNPGFAMPGRAGVNGVTDDFSTRFQNPRQRYRIWKSVPETGGVSQVCTDPVLGLNSSFSCMKIKNSGIHCGSRFHSHPLIR